MSPMCVAFAAGLFVGTIVGMFVMALMVIASDKREPKVIRERK